jgi:uncharacterized protein
VRGTDLPIYQWDPLKNESKESKHDITFEEAVIAFKDPKRLETDSTRPGDSEERRKVVGRVGDRLIAVIYTMRNDRFRIISAKKIRSNEEREYGQG